MSVRPLVRPSVGNDRVRKCENPHFRPCPPVRNWWPCFRPCSPSSSSFRTPRNSTGHYVRPLVYPSVCLSLGLSMGHAGIRKCKYAHLGLHLGCHGRHRVCVKGEGANPSATIYCKPALLVQSLSLSLFLFFFVASLSPSRPLPCSYWTSSLDHFEEGLDTAEAMTMCNPWMTSCLSLSLSISLSHILLFINDFQNHLAQSNVFYCTDGFCYMVLFVLYDLWSPHDIVAQLSILYHDSFLFLQL